MIKADHNIQARIISLVFFIIITLLSFMVISHINEKWQQERRVDLQRVMQTQVFALEKSIHRRISSAKILAAWLSSKDGKVDNFERFSAGLIEAIGGISNLQLAPGGIVQYVFPLAGHERALGHNILRDDARVSEARLAIMSNQLTLAGPFKLKQGGTAIIGRQPIFLPKLISSNNSAASLPNDFWGFASALIYIDQLIENTSLDQLYQQGYYFQLWRYNPDTGGKEIIYQNTLKDISQHVHATIALPNAIWHLSIEEVKAQHQKFDITPIVILVVLFDFLLGFVVYRYFVKKYRTQTSLVNVAR